MVNNETMPNQGMNRVRRIHMHSRSELEQPRTLEEMQSIIDTFANNNDEYSNSQVRLRTGVAGPLIEEYMPLFRLAESLPGFNSASLTAASHPGPDANLLFEDGSQKTVQITCAGDDKSTALQRELLNDRQIVFANQSFKRKRKSREIVKSGRLLTSHTANTDAVIDEVMLAIEKKEKKYRAGTDYLLISIRRSEITMTKDWQQQLTTAVSALPTSSYERIYVATAHTCFACKQIA